MTTIPAGFKSQPVATAEMPVTRDDVPAIEPMPIGGGGRPWHDRAVQIVASPVLAVVRCTFLIILVSISLSTPSAKAQLSSQWTQVFPTSLDGAVSAFDSRRGVVVVVGQSRASVFVAAGNIGALETWEWNSVSWSLRAVGGPSRRTGQSLVFDQARGVVVMFGGTSTATSNGDTWEWNGSSWTVRNISGPTPRSGQAMVYDSSRNVTVLFGGRTGPGVYNGETWEYNGIVWALRSTSGPLGRHLHSMTFDSLRSETVLFGGQTSSSAGGISSQTWIWNGTGWTQRMVTGPSARTSAAMAFDSTVGVAVLFGGQASNSTSAETWQWNGVNWASQGGTGPSPRSGAALVFDSARSKLTLFSSSANTPDLWDRSGSVWSQRSVGGPPGRTGFGLTFDAGQGAVLLYGGSGSSGLLSDLWMWDGRDWTQSAQIGLAPMARHLHVMAFDAARGQTVVFGGRRTTNDYNGETWLWNGTSWSQALVAGPPPRIGAALVYDSVRGELVLFGGVTTNNVLCGDTWVWNGNAWTQRLVSAPSPRADHAMAFDSSRGVLVLFGGRTGTIALSDETWIWNGTAWSLAVTSARPPAQDGHTMAYDAQSDAIVLFSGDGGTNNETWRYTTAGWSEVNATGVQNRNYRMVYDSVRNLPTLYGGSNSGTGFFISETWSLSSNCESDIAGPNQSIGPDGVLTADDIIVFLGWFFASDARADIAGPNQSTTPDTNFTADDIIVFLGRFFAGC